MWTICTDHYVCRSLFPSHFQPPRFSSMPCHYLQSKKCHSGARMSEWYSPLLSVKLSIHTEERQRMTLLVLLETCYTRPHGPICRSVILFHPTLSNLNLLQKSTTEMTFKTELINFSFEWFCLSPYIAHRLLVAQCIQVMSERLYKSTAHECHHKVI